MAHFLNFFVPLGFSVLGLWAFISWPGGTGIAAFIGLFLIGSMIGSRLFKRYATLEQIKQDLRTRIDNQ